jgi:hypothetical protein
LIFIAITFICFILFSPLGVNPQIDEAIQSAGIFVALLACILALSVADSKRKLVMVSIKPNIDKKFIGKYPKNELSNNLKQVYRNFSDPVTSHQVHFKMTNISGFTLIKPTLTFSLPLQKQHPFKLKEEQIYSKQSFNSNLFNSQRELRLLEFSDKRILSNSNLPYWNDKDEITIWIRMVLDDSKLEPFIIEVSVNCENADGVTNKVIINPSELHKG